MLRVRELLLELFCNLCLTPCGLKIQIRYKETRHGNVGIKCWEESGWALQVVCLNADGLECMALSVGGSQAMEGKQAEHSTKSQSLVGRAAAGLTSGNIKERTSAAGRNQDFTELCCLSCT